MLNDMRARAFYFAFQKSKLQSTWHVARDMQAVLPCPRFVDNPNQNFYMRYKSLFMKKRVVILILTSFMRSCSQLNTYHMGIYTGETSSMTSALWSEYEGTRQVDEMLSSVHHFIETKVPDNVQHLVHWSDNCTSQNKCWNLLFFCAWEVARKRFESVELRFLVKGSSSRSSNSRFAHHSIE